ncbi:MAG: SUMF1/EgtB/PvdO family nonheme iron enzyme [Myxococcota bacterium]
MNEDETVEPATWLSDGAERAAATETLPERVADRYDRRERLGRGGTSEVWRVFDTQLERAVALKVLHHPAAGSSWERFEAEARVSAQLQHPGIVPVHDLGRLDDGRVWFTMKEVRGRTLGALIDEVHAEGGPFRRLLEGFLRVCEAVAFAHHEGLVHRDLKPSNIMFGDFGAVYVLDWGLAKHRSAGETAVEPADPGLTRDGTVSGTPLYMAPEQAQGRTAEVGPAADVYALGATLYHVLTGRPPRTGLPLGALLEAVATGSPIAPPSTHRTAAPTDPAIDAITLRALSHRPEDRYADAGALTSELAAWLDGARRRAAALEVVQAADRARDEAVRCRSEADVLWEAGSSALAAIAAWRPETDKAEAWAQQDAATDIRMEARRADVEADRLLHAALQIEPGLLEAHVRLVERARIEHAAAEAERAHGALRHEAALRMHASALPESHPVRRRANAYLDGRGTLHLVTNPPGATVTLERLGLRARRLVAVEEVYLGETPLHGVPLPMGTYVARLEHPDRDPVRYPVEIGREGVWDGIPPGASEPEPVWLPPRGFVPAGSVYVPAGWFRAGGGPPSLRQFPERRLWCPAFLIDRHPVTNAKLIEFLDDLVDQGREEDALRFAPRARGKGSRMNGDLIYARTPDGHFTLGVDSEGHAWEPDLPVVLVDRTCVAGYLAWRSARTGRAWRMPQALEYEKAVRGVDGRSYPWGEAFDASWCCMSDSHEGDRKPVSIERFPVDCSVYGVRGGAGNVLTWCEDAADAPLPEVRVVRVPPGPDDRIFVSRGGTWASSVDRSRCTTRSRLEDHRATTLGLRAALTVEPD